MIGMVIICALITYTYLLQPRPGPGLKQLLENPQPIPSQNLFDVSVAESAFDQSAGEVARMRVVR
jgi:hypothetical protein